MDEQTLSSRGAPRRRFDDFFAAALDRQALAEAKAGGPVSRRFLLAGNRVELRFACSALLSALTDALSHLATDDEETPALTIRIWDEESTGIGPPSPRW